MWTKLDDGFFLHRKVIRLEPSAKLLHVAALVHCAGNLTDGLLTPADVRIVSAHAGVEETHVEALVSAGLWEIRTDGFQIHDWHDFNPSAADVKAKRRENAG
jgi:hypothetical protein